MDWWPFACKPAIALAQIYVIELALHKTGRLIRAKEKTLLQMHLDFMVFTFIRTGLARVAMYGSFTKVAAMLSHFHALKSSI